MENWSLVEIAWTLVAVLGAFFSFRNLRDGLADLAVLNIDKPKKESSRIDVLEHAISRIIALGNIRRDGIRLVIQLTFLGIGVWAGIMPPSGSVSTASFVFSIVMIALSLGLTVSSTSDYTDRVRIRQLGQLHNLELHNLERKNGV